MQDLTRYTLIDLTTFRRDGCPVSTPVRFAIDGDHIVVSLQTDSGKVKRALRDPHVVVAGHPDGPPHDATLRFVDGAEARRADAALRRRHPLLFVQRLLTGRRPRRHRLAVVEL